MKDEGPAVRLTILLGEGDQWHQPPLFSEIVHRAHSIGLAGATVLLGIEGFGASSRIRTSRLGSLGNELPVAIIIDSAERVEAFLPQLDEPIGEGLVLLDPVTPIRYRGGGPDADQP